MDSVAFYPLFYLLTKCHLMQEFSFFFLVAYISSFLLQLWGGLLGELFEKTAKTFECRTWPCYVFLEILRVPHK